ncbi:hypothetical protein AC578_1861 [Pseudocercospora eumusae]|uniref:F-box domain-containing protein n=1 Tax=Pseudocercospora eumusae TaxID=321146 RepID=A0A139GYD2_9PEZI|nr:hypothetical protein AC578_1861 [Pseudocercospora eumusae]
MAAVDVQHLPTEWLNRIWSSIRGTSDLLPRPFACHRENMKLNRQKVIHWAQDKQARMTPWGVQYLSPERGEWVPYLHAISDGAICGRWFRELHCFRHLTYLAQTSHLADPSLDIMKHEKLDTVPPRNDSCRITELPTELLQHIISYLLPSNTTYQFFPARLDTTRSVQIVQKFTPQPAVKENAPPSYQPVRYNTTDRPPATASAHLALAATCKRLQEEVYSSFFAGNSFILHITAGTIQNAVRSRDFRQFQTWTRILPNSANDGHSSSWPITARASRYMRNLTLIISLPPAPVSKDIDILEAKVSKAIAALSAANHLDNLTVNLHQSLQKRDKRYTAQILNIESLEAEVDAKGKLSIAVREPNVQSVRSWNKAQRVLRPLLRGPKNVKKVVLSGPISDDLVEELQNALKGAAPAETPKRAAETEEECSYVSRATKKRRI